MPLAIRKTLSFMSILLALKFVHLLVTPVLGAGTPDGHALNSAMHSLNNTLANMTSDVPFQFHCVDATTPPLCYALNIPTSRGLENDIFLSASGPSSTKYAAIGFGSTGMRNTQMLLMFPIQGKVVANFRAGDMAQAHKMPISILGPSVDILKSSNDGKEFHIEMRLKNARHAQGRAILDLNDTKGTNFIWAMGDTEFGAFGEDASKYVTKYHGKKRGTFTLDLTKATASGKGGIPPTAGTIEAQKAKKNNAGFTITSPFLFILASAFCLYLNVH